MCGIVGVLSDHEAAPILVDALKRLEYRGYDSAGVATINDAGQLHRRRAVGKLVNLSDLLVRFGNEGIHFCSLAEGINTTTPGGKLVYHLFAAFAEFQRDIIRENTMLGLAAARARGASLGRPRLLSITDVLEGHRQIMQFGTPVREVADCLEVSQATLTRGLKSAGLETRLN